MSKEPEGKGGAEKLTDRSASVVLFNNWDVPIRDITFTHTVADVPRPFTIPQLAVGAQSAKLGIQYKTGFNAPHDYWLIKFTATGGNNPGTWTCKNNFYCDLRASDDGTVVLVQVSGGDRDMYISESSGQCYVSLHPA